MPFDPNSTRNPLPPLNDGYPDDWHVPPSAQDDSFPDDWHVPPSAQDDSFPDDWFVPPSAQDDSFPDDWHVPPSAQGDGFPDDWFVPESALPSASQTTPIAQPNAGSPSFAASPAPPTDSIAAYWARIGADRQRATPWAPPVFPDAYGQFPPSPFAPAPFNFAPNPPGLFGNPPKILAWQPSFPSGGLLANMAANPAAPLSNFPPGMLFGGVAPTPPDSDTPFPNLPRDVLFGGNGRLTGSLVSNQGDPSSVTTLFSLTKGSDRPGSDTAASPAFLRSDAESTATNVGFSSRSVPRTLRKPAENSPAMAEKSAPYSPTLPNYHEYEFEDYLCDIDDPGCSIQNAYDGLLRHAVPGNPEEGAPIENGKRSEATLDGKSGGFVRTWTEPESSSIVNETEPGHIFESGVVQRQIVQRGSKSYIRMHGQGNNTSPWLAALNKFLAPGAFMNSTESIRAWVRRKGAEGQ